MKDNLGYFSLHNPHTQNQKGHILDDMSHDVIEKLVDILHNNT